MKERPILFNGEMVRAILDGRKTQTRRPVKYPEQWMIEFDGEQHTYEDQYGESRDVLEWSPFGTAGDRLWVRETFRHFSNVTHCENGHRYVGMIYKADNKMHLNPWGDRPTSQPVESWWNTGNTPWTQSIHMPRWASRITLEVKRVWVEQVQEITRSDIRAEGVVLEGDVTVDTYKRMYVDAWTALWDSIYAKQQGLAWEDNPWVWCCEFEWVQP